MITLRVNVCSRVITKKKTLMTILASTPVDDKVLFIISMCCSYVVWNVQDTIMHDNGHIFLCKFGFCIINAAWKQNLNKMYYARLR